MTDLQMWALIVGFFLPIVESAIVQFHWSHGVQAVAGFLACAVAGGGTAYFEADLNGKTFVQAGLVVLVAAITAYHGFWKPTGVAGRIEDMTSPGDRTSLRPVS